MTDISRAAADPTSPAIELLTFLKRLARPGARLRISTSGAAIAAKTSKRQSGSQTTPVPPGLIQAARAAGYMMTIAALPGHAHEGPCEVLSPAGRAAVRTALIASAVPPDGRVPTSRRTQRRAGLADGISAQRPAERLTLVEQLGLRRDGHQQPLLHHTQVAAALRFAQDFNRGHMQARVTARWSAEAIPERRRRGAPGAGVELLDSISAAQARTRAALAGLGSSMANIAIDVCCYDRGLESIEADRHWPRGAARVALSLTLEQLGKHYGMIVEAHTRPAFTRKWGAHGYKPTTEPSDKARIETGLEDNNRD